MFDTRGVSPSPTRAEAAALAELDPRVRPLTLAAERTLPVLPALGALLPAGLPRGATLAVSGSAGRSFAVALLAAASQAGSWVAVVGVPGFGWRAAAEVGLDLARVVVVDPVPPAVVPECLGALVDGFDAVLLGAEARVPGALGPPPGGPGPRARHGAGGGGRALVPRWAPRTGSSGPPRRRCRPSGSGRG